MIPARSMLRVREVISSLQSQGLDLSVVPFATICDFLPEETASKERRAAMIVSVLRGHTNDEDVFWHKR